MSRVGARHRRSLPPCPTGEPSSAVRCYEGERGGGVAAHMAGGISGWGGTKEDSVIAQGKGIK